MTTWQRTKSDEVFKRNKQFYARFSLLNERVEQCLFIKIDEEKAFSRAVEKVNEIKKAILNKEDWRGLFVNENSKNYRANAVLVGECWAQFYDYRKRGSKLHKKKPWREKTAKEYANFWNRYFKPFWENKLPREITQKSWEEYIKFAQGKSKKGEALLFENHHKYFRAFCTYLLKEGKIEKMPEIYNPDPEKEDDDGSGTVYTDEAVKQMIELSEGPLKLYVMMGALLGMRSSEITQLHKSRIDLNSMMIRLKAKDVKTGSKTNRGRNIPIPGRVLPLLMDQIEAHSKSNYLFPNFRKNEGDRPMDPTGFKDRWDKVRTQAGYPDGRFHDLRHTYATKVFSNPMINPVLAAKALGMTMATAEKVYINFKDEHFKIITSNFSYGDFV